MDSMVLYYYVNLRDAGNGKFIRKQSCEMTCIFWCIRIYWVGVRSIWINRLRSKEIS